MIRFRKTCRFLLGNDEVRCVAREYYNDPCCTCCYEDGREDMYIPAKRLVCPVCGNGKDPGTLICSGCQPEALWWLGWLGALKAEPDL